MIHVGIFTCVPYLFIIDNVIAASIPSYISDDLIKYECSCTTEYNNFTMNSFLPLY